MIRMKYLNCSIKNFFNKSKCAIRDYCPILIKITFYEYNGFAENLSQKYSRIILYLKKKNYFEKNLFKNF